MPRRCNDYSSSEDPPKKKMCNMSTLSSTHPKHEEFLRDVTGKEWKLGKAIGVGGFGEIYLASDDLTKEVKTDSEYVAKMESHKNGPLFVEVNCYLRIAKQEMIEEWKKQKKIDCLGMPHYVASGSHMQKGERFRFLILPRFAKDLQKVLEEKKTLNIKTVLTIASQIIDVLEYIHSKGYIHSDIKASNILLSNRKVAAVAKKTQNRSTRLKYNRACNPMRACRSKKTTRVVRNLRPQPMMSYVEDDFEMFSDSDSVDDGVSVEDDPQQQQQTKDQLYLLDYGLASKFLTSKGEHKPFCADERKAHAGTVLFCSRDAHKGVPSRRSDLESLGYNIIYWLTGNLPWVKDIDDPEIVSKKKHGLMMDVDYFLKKCFDGYPQFLLDYFQYLQRLQFQDKPDYTYCKKLFEQSIKDYGFNNDSLFDFENVEKSRSRQNAAAAKKVAKENIRANKKFNYTISRLPLKSNVHIKPALRKKVKNAKPKGKKKWFETLPDPEIILKQAREKKNSENHEPNTSILDMNIYTMNPTYAMVEVYNKCMERAEATPPHRGEGDGCCENIDGYTPAMMSVLHRMRQRQDLEREQLAVNAATNKNGKIGKKCVNNRSKKKVESLVKHPPHSRNVKSAPVLKKELCQTRKPKNLALRRTYSLRG